MGRPQGTRKVLVSRIHTSIDEKAIHSLLSKFGIVISYEVHKGLEKDRSEYYVIATYKLPEQAHQAVRSLANYWFEGSTLRVEFYNPNYGDMNGGPNPHHNKRHNGHMGGRGNPGMPNGGPAGGHGGHHGARGGSSMMNGHMNGSLRSPMGGPGYYSGNVGHQPPKELPVRMLVPSDMVGAIIGKSGATITSITQESQAKVEVNKKNAGGIYADGQMDKVINIYGVNEACSQACKRILEVMLQESQQPNANTTNGAGASRRRDEPITLRLLAHNNLVGRVIGRGGIVIKKIMEETNAKINVSQMTDPRERVIVIKGNLEEMSKAQQQITSKMRQCYEQDLQQAMMGGYGGPDMGPPPPQQIPPALSYAFHRPPLPPPLPHSYHGGPNGHHGGPHHPSNAFGPPGPYGHLGMSSPSGHFYPMGDGSVEVVHVWVPSCTVGAIIGTGGSSIREMIRASGCSIKVSQTNAKDEIKAKVDESAQPKQNESENSVETPSSSSAGTEGSHSTRRDGGIVTSHPNPSDRRVTVTGTGEAQWKAQCLLYRKVFLESGQHLDLNPDVASDPQIRAGHLRVEINVPSNQVGRIIGKGGSTVKDMQRQSRAIIKLPEETSKRAGSPDEAVETPLYIIGDFYAVQAAQRRIRALIARNSQGGPTVANGSHAKKQPDETATQKVEGVCDQSESQC